MNQNTIYLGIDVHKKNFSLCVSTMNIPVRRSRYSRKLETACLE